MSNTFFNSKHCQERRHCHVCRDRKGGRVWRIGLVQSFRDVKHAEFVCPHGLDWGAAASAPTKKPCRSCARPKATKLNALIKGLTGVIRAVLRIGTVPTAVARSRRDACAACPHATMRGTVCALCRCLLRAKTSLKDEACPDNRWPDKD